MQGSLYNPLPEGFVYRPDFISADQERGLIGAITGLRFGSVVMHGITARRRVIHFGLGYSFTSRGVTDGPPIPDFLSALAVRAAALIDVEAAELREVLVTEYTPGAAIGWHRDAPPFGRIVGISLGTACRMRMRRYREADRSGSISIDLEPRSAYTISGPARSSWEHSIPAVKALRYSITFRTLRPQNQGRQPDSIASKRF